MHKFNIIRKNDANIGTFPRYNPINEPSYGCGEDESSKGEDDAAFLLVFAYGSHAETSVNLIEPVAAKLE